MVNNGEMAESAGLGLLGVEIGRNRVRLALLDRSGHELHDAVERPIAKAGGPRDPIEQEYSTRSAIEAGLSRLDIVDPGAVVASATIGFPNCGVGSGPALRQWLDALSADLGEPVVYTGDVGISYAPASCVDFVGRVFEPIGLLLERVELAPVAAARVLGTIQTGAITLGSGIAWSARLLDGQVLEAFEGTESGFDDSLQVLTNGVGEPISALSGFTVDSSLRANRGLSPATLAPAIGVATGLSADYPGNLLDGTYLGMGAPSTGETPFVRPPVERSRGPVPAGGRVRSADPHLFDGGGRPADPAPLDGRHHRMATASSYAAPLRHESTHQLRRVQPPVSRSRELSGDHVHVRPVAEDPLFEPARSDRGDTFDPVPSTRSEPAGQVGFLESDFVLGVLITLAIALTVSLVVL